MSNPRSGPSRLLRRINLASLLIGAIALAWMTCHVGLDRIGDGLTRIGLGFAVACTAHLVHILMDAITMQSCAAAAGRKVSYWTFARTSLAGHAINEATPMGKLGEITKFTLLSAHFPPERAAATLIVQNFVMFVVGCVVIALAPHLAILFVDEVDPYALKILWAISITFALMGAGGLYVMWRGIGEWPFRLFRRLGVAGVRVDRWREGWRKVEIAWSEATADPRYMRAAWLSSCSGRIASIGEALTILTLLGSEHVFAAALLSIANYQFIFWTTGFVPLQAGTAEGGAYFLFRAVGLSPESGVLLELVRKARRLVFIAIGITLLGWQTFKLMIREPDQPAPNSTAER